MMKRFLVDKNVLWISLSMMVYYLIMEAYYLYFIVVNYGRFRFHLDFSTPKYIETKIIFILLLMASVFVSKLSEFIYATFIFFVVFFLIPTLITYSFSNDIPGPLYANVGLLVGLGATSLFKVKLSPIRRLPFTDGVTMLMVALVLSPIIFQFGMYVNLGNFYLDDIDKTRSFFDENSATWINYLYHWLVKAIIPLFMVFFFIRKRYGYALISLSFLLYLYIISGNKIVYITLFVMLFFLFAGKNYFEKTKYFSYALIAGLLILPLLDFYVLHSHSFKGIFVMRMLFLPAKLNYTYFDFFKDNPLYFAESSFFKLFVEYPYDRPIGYIISEMYFDAPDMNANNGIIGDGYMNLGYTGVVLNILIISVLFFFFNSANLDSRYLGIFFVMIFLFLSAPMLSMFITSGLWIIVILSLTLMRGKEETPET